MDPFDREKAIERIEIYRGLKDGWAEPDSLGPSQGAFVETIAFVDALSRAGVKYQPGIGLDTGDGAFSFDWFSHWAGKYPLPKDGLKVSLSFHNDGTYSFWAQHKDVEAHSNSESVTYIHEGLKDLINNAYD